MEVPGTCLLRCVTGSVYTQVQNHQHLFHVGKTDVVAEDENHYNL